MLLGIPMSAWAAPGTALALPRVAGTDPGCHPHTLGGGVTMALFTPGPHGDEGWGALWSLHLCPSRPLPALRSQELQPRCPQLAPSSTGSRGGPDSRGAAGRI